MSVCKSESDKMNSINKKITETENNYSKRFNTSNIIVIISEHEHEKNCYGMILRIVSHNFWVKIFNDGKMIFDQKKQFLDMVVNPRTIEKLDLMIETMEKVHIQQSEAILETLKIIKSNYIINGLLSKDDLAWMNEVYSRCKSLVIEPKPKREKE